MTNGISYSSVSKGIRPFDESDYDDLINLMKTGIGESKYCIPQPFSRCLISLCRSLFDFNFSTDHDLVRSNVELH